MLKLRFPEHHLQGFKFLIELPQEQKNQFVDELAKLPVGLMPSAAAKILEGKLSLDKEQLQQSLRVIASLYWDAENSGVETDFFVETVIEALAVNNLKPPDDFKAFLKSVLSLKDSFYLTLLAVNLFNEREKLLLNTRILTDIRPVFGPDEKLNAKGFLVVHNLKVEYRRGDNTVEEVYFALDNVDLKKLKEHIVRAEEKEKVIRERFDKLEVQFIDIKR